MGVIQTEVVIVGAGPCGLFQVFELGLLGIKAHLLDSLERPGGQCTELYPEKPIYDIPAIPVCGAQELVDRLMEQIKPFGASMHFGHEVTGVHKREDGRFDVTTAGGLQFDAGAIVIAGGVGSFQPRRLGVEGGEQFEGTQLHYRVQRAAEYQGRNVVIFGGGDSALDWTLDLVDRAASLTLVHRRPEFRAAPASVAKMHALVEAGRLRFVEGVAQSIVQRDGKLTGVGIKDTGGTIHELAADRVLAFFGLHPKLGPIAEWGMELEKRALKVDTEKFQTSIPGIFAVGDINTYPGKKKLILSGFHEAALAAFAIQHHLYPEKRQFLQYTTTSPIMHQRLGVPDPTQGLSIVQSSLSDLLQLLKLERLEINLFRGTSRDIGSAQVFGGQVLGQALSAAYATIEGRRVHSLHAYFLRRGDFNAPIVYEVDRSRDGHSFSSRRVVAIQHGEQIFHMAASFQEPEAGLEHQLPMPDVPRPESLPDLRESIEAQHPPLPAAVKRFTGRDSPFEFRSVQPLDFLNPQRAEPRLDVWFRTVDRLGDDEQQHNCLLAYVSDYYLIGTAMRPHGYTMASRGVIVASIDHAMWFHRPMRVDEWLLYSIESPSASGARGFARASLFSLDGRLVGSTAQEGLLRVPPAKG